MTHCDSARVDIAILSIFARKQSFDFDAGFKVDDFKNVMIRDGRTLMNKMKNVDHKL